MRRAVLTGVFCLSMLQAAIAGGLSDKAAEAEAALSAGKPQEAIALMRSALVEAWKATPLSLQKAVFVAEPASGYGVYNVRPDNVFGAGQPLLIYMEPVGFTWAQQGSTYQSHIVADFDLLTPDGRVLAGQKDFGSFQFVSHEHNTEYMATMTLNLTGAPAASYVLQITLRDQMNNDQSVSVRMPFEIK